MFSLNRAERFGFFIMSDYKYDAFCEEVTDGDTCDCLIDLGFKTHRREKIRFYGIDTPESRTRDLEEKTKGLAVKLYVTEKIEGKRIQIETTKQGKFGRYLGIIYYQDGDKWVNLNKELVDKKMAKEYWGGKRIK